MLSSVANLRLLGYPIVIAAFIGMGLYLHHSGYRSGVMDTTALFEAKIKAEHDREVEINKTALEEANRRAIIYIKKLHDQSLLVEQLRQEGASDPSANNDAISADSLRRIFSIH